MASAEVLSPVKLKSVGSRPTPLKKVKPKEIDSSKSLQMQRFQIKYTEGEPVEDVFSRIQHKRRKEP